MKVCEGVMPRLGGGSFRHNISGERGTRSEDNRFPL